MYNYSRVSIDDDNRRRYMKRNKKTNKSALLVFTMLVVLALACGTSSVSQEPSGDAGLQQTMVAISIAETMVAVQQTQVSAGGGAEPPPVSPPVVVPTTESLPPSAPTQDINALIKNANVLLYEDTWDIGSWVYDTLKLMGLKVTNDGDAIGHFLEHLASGTKYDLVIVASESHSKVQGEIWDAILTNMNRSHKPALIAEMWYLNFISEGKIKPFTTECGIQWQKDIPSATKIYWFMPDSPVFNNPTVLPSMNWPGGYWEDAGDEISLLPGSRAEMLAGTQLGGTSDHGTIARCYDGRVIVQTFCNHDFSRGDIQPLWKNYITNVLEAHFKAIQ
jgi:hypothetical protein